MSLKLGQRPSLYKYHQNSHYTDGEFDVPIPNDPYMKAYLAVNLGGPGARLCLARPDDITTPLGGGTRTEACVNYHVYDCAPSVKDSIKDDVVVVYYNSKAMSAGENTKSVSVGNNVRIIPLSKVYETNPEVAGELYRHTLTARYNKGQAFGYQDPFDPEEIVTRRQLIEAQWLGYENYSEIHEINDKIKSMMTSVDFTRHPSGQEIKDTLASKAQPTSKTSLAPLDAGVLQEPEWSPIAVPWIPTKSEARVRWKPGFTRIGYTALMMPPEQIIYTREQPLETKQLLRANGSLKRGYGHSLKTFQFQLQITDVATMNKVLLPLVRQFQKTPFLPVENELLNDTYDVQALALETVQVSTVPGMPGAMDVVLQASEFNWRAYLPGEFDFDSTICYPLLKLWCENINTTDTRPIGWDKKNKRVAANPTLSGELAMYLPEEKFLQDLEDLENHQYNESVMYQLMQSDAARIQAAKAFANSSDGHEEIYKACSPEKAGTCVSGQMVTYNFLTVPQDLADRSLPSSAVRTVQSRPHPVLIHGPAVAIKIRNRTMAKRLLDTLAGDLTRTTRSEGADWDFEDVPFDRGLFITPEDDRTLVQHKRTGSKGCYEITSGTVRTEKWMRDFVKGKVESVVSGQGGSRNAMTVDDVLDSSYFVFPTNGMAALEPLLKMANEAKASRKPTDSSSTSDATITADGRVLLDSKWERMTLDSFVVEQITVGSENLMTVLMPQMQDSPVHQFLGRADSQVVVRGTITDQKDVDALRMLLDKEEYLTRRYGGLKMSSAPSSDGQYPYAGYMYLENEICQLMGVGHVIPAKCEVRTIKDFPGTFEVEIVFTQFNPMQQKREEPGAIDDNSWYIDSAGGISVENGPAVQTTSDGYVEHILRAEYLHSKLRTMELYPDMSLPTYKTLAEWIDGISTPDAKARDTFLRSLAIQPSQFAWTSAHCESIPKVMQGTADTRAYLDPDFYCATSFPVGREFIDGVLETLSGGGTNRGGTDLLDPNREHNRTRDRYGDGAPLPFHIPRLAIAGATAEAHKKRYDAISIPQRSASTGEYTGSVQVAPENLKKLLKEKKFSDSDINAIEKYSAELGVPVSVAMHLFACEGGVGDTSGNHAGIGQMGANEMATIKKTAESYGMKCPWSSLAASDRYNNEKAIWASLAFYRTKHDDVRARVLKTTGGKGITGGQAAGKIWAFADSIYIRGGKYLNEITATRSIDDALNALPEDSNRTRERALGIANLPYVTQVSSAVAAPKAESKPAPAPSGGASYKIATFHNPPPWTGYRHDESLRVVNPVMTKVGERNPTYILEFNDDKGQHHRLHTTWTNYEGYFGDDIKQYMGNTSGHYMRFYTEDDRPAYLLDRDEPVGDFKSYLQHIGYTELQLDALVKDPTGKDQFNIDVNKDPLVNKMRQQKPWFDQTIKNNDVDEVKRPKTFFGSDLQYIADTDAGIVHNPISSGPPTYTVPQMFLRGDGNDMFYDMRNYSCHGRLVQAFPTYCLLLVDGGRWLRFWRIYDHLYGMTAVESIEVFKTRKQAADVAHVVFSNMFGHLARQPAEQPRTRWTADGVTTTNGTVVSWSLPMVVGAIQDSIAGGFNAEDLMRWKQHVKGLLLKPGARIHIRMGFGSNPNKIPVMFNGVISEVSPGGDSIDVVGLGDGIELEKSLEPNASDADGKTVYRAHSLFGAGTTPREIINGILAPTGFVELFTSGGYDRNNPHGIEHFGSPTYHFMSKDIGEISMNIYDATTESVGSDRNVVADSNAWEGAIAGLNLIPGYGMIDQGASNFVFGISMEDATAWDVITTCRRSVPEYIAAVHPFGLRSTLFYGKPHWPLRFDYKPETLQRSTKGSENAVDFTGGKSTGGELGFDNYGVKDLDDITYWKPYSQVHVIASTVNLISNQVRASDEDVYTISQAIGSHNAIFGPDKSDNDWSDKVFLDTDIYPENQKILYVKSGLYSTDSQKLVDMLHNLNFAAPLFTRKVSNTYAVNAMKDTVKDMYRGQVVILGDPSYKPYDRVFFADTRTEMSGLVEVKEVTHHLSFATGLVTTVTPDLVCSVAEMSDQLAWGWQAQFGHRLVGALGMQYMIGAVAAKKANPLVALAKLDKRLMEAADASLPEVRRVRERISEFATRLQHSAGESASNWADTVLENPEKYTETLDTLTKDLDETIRDIFEITNFPDANTTPKIMHTQNGASVMMEPEKEAVEAAANAVKGARTEEEAIGKAREAAKATKLASGASRAEALRTAKMAETLAQSQFAGSTLTGRTKRQVDVLLTRLRDYREANKIENACARIGKGVGEALKAGDGMRLNAFWTEAKQLKIVEALGRRGSIASTAAKVGKLTLWTLAVDSLFEWVNRKLAYRQCLVLRPLMIDGREFVAGINGHLGCIAGDPQGFWDGVIQSMTNIDYQKRHHKGLFYDFNSSSSGLVGDFGHAALGLSAILAAVAGVNAATYGGHSDEDFDNFAFGGVTYDQEEQEIRYAKFKKHINDIYSTPIDQGGDGREGELVTGNPSEEVKRMSQTGFSRTLTSEPKPGDYGANHCGRYAHDVMTANGWVGPKRTPGSIGRVSGPHDESSWRTGDVLTGKTANTLANLQRGMLIHLKSGDRYSSGHFAVISDNMTLNENLGGHVRCDRPVSRECQLNAIDWAVMPKYRK